MDVCPPSEVCSTSGDIRERTIGCRTSSPVRPGGDMKPSSVPDRASNLPMLHAAPVVFVVDDDISVRESLESLIHCAGWQAETYASAQEFLARQRALCPSCLVLDFGLPGLNGLELQERVGRDRPDMPIIFITGHGD